MQVYACLQPSQPAQPRISTFCRLRPNSHSPSGHGRGMLLLERQRSQRWLNRFTRSTIRPVRGVWRILLLAYLLGSCAPSDSGDTTAQVGEGTDPTVSEQSGASAPLGDQSTASKPDIPTPPNNLTATPLAKAWAFHFTKGQMAQRPPNQVSGLDGRIYRYRVGSLADQCGGYGDHRYDVPQCKEQLRPVESDLRPYLWVEVSKDGTVSTVQTIHPITDQMPHSYAVALAPGHHYARLYLETDGEVTTLLSNKNDFTVIGTPDIGSLSFLFRDGTVRDPMKIFRPSISQGAGGLYLLTFDNAALDGWSARQICPSFFPPTFGLAFSADGLHWTVYDDQLTVQGLSGDVSTAPSRVHGPCGPDRITGGIASVSPSILTDLIVQITFTYDAAGDSVGHCGGPCPRFYTGLATSD